MANSILYNCYITSFVMPIILQLVAYVLHHYYLFYHSVLRAIAYNSDLI
jgi:hypothetical protein